MNREEVAKEIQLIQSDNILLELPTSMGKTKQALDLMSKLNPNSILILVPRLVLIASWMDEFAKWGYNDYLQKVTFSTYVGVKKHVGKAFDLLIADECHHFTDKSLEYVYNSIDYKSSILLSATVGKSQRQILKDNFKGLYCYQITAKQAIDNNILPDPRVFLIPYTLDNVVRSEVFEASNGGKGKHILCNYEDKWKYLKDKSYTSVHLRCTQLQYINELNAKVDYWKRMSMRSRNDMYKNKWLYLAGLRLKMLSTFKNPIIKIIQSSLRNYRCLTFCNSIEQTQILGENCINSQNKDSSEVLGRFNDGLVSHITSCNMLNEGVNLVNCQVGIYASLNSSEIMIKQKLGRLLRHPHPVLIIPYYKGTRDEDIVEKMLEDYNKELITEVTDLNEIKI